MVAHLKNNFKLIMILRIALVVLTIGGFFNIFFDSMVFDDARPDILDQFARGGATSVTATQSP